jgi:hypothetical protein
MSKISLTNLVNLQNETTAVTAINANNAVLTTALENTLSRDGTSPNTMGANLDMNSFSIINLPIATLPTQPVRLQEVGNAPAYATAAAASAAAALVSQNAASSSASTASTSATNAGTSATNAATSATNAGTSATNAAASAVTAANNATVVAGNFYNFSSTTTMADPSSSNLRFNNAAVGSVTSLALSVNTADSGNPSIRNFLTTWGASSSTANRGTLLIRKVGTPATYAIFSITSVVTDNTTWVQMTVAFVSSNGSFANADSMSVQFYRTGDAGSGTISGATNHGVGLATGASSMTSTAVMTDGQLLVGQTAADPLPKTITGDVTFSAAGAATIKTSVSLVTPVLNVATATSINKVALTQPATAATLTIADNKTLTCNNNLTFSGTDGSTLAVGPGGTLTGSSSSAIFYDNIPQNSQSAAYQLVLSDAQKHIFHPSADVTARTFTIPANSTVAFPVGTVVTFVNQNAAGVITIAITTDTLRLSPGGTTGSRTLAANGMATALKVTSTEWIISGTGLT